MVDYPPPPWVLEGNAYQLVSVVPLEAARRLTPPELELVCVLPGCTAGGVWLAAYSGASTIHYSEMIVFSSLVRAEESVGAWVASIYVDSPASLEGGRAIWGLPKQIARFAWGPGSVCVNQGESTICRLDFGAPGPLSRVSVPLPLLAPAVSVVDGGTLFFQGHGSSLVSLGRAVWGAPVGGELEALGLTGRRWTLRHRQMKLTVPSPVGTR